MRFVIRLETSPVLERSAVTVTPHSGGKQRAIGAVAGDGRPEAARTRQIPKVF